MDNITVRELSEQIGVSKPTIRAAINALHLEEQTEQRGNRLYISPYAAEQIKLYILGKSENNSEKTEKTENKSENLENVTENNSEKSKKTENNSENTENETEKMESSEGAVLRATIELLQEQIREQKEDILFLREQLRQKGNELAKEQQLHTLTYNRLLEIEHKASTEQSEQTDSTVIIDAVQSESSQEPKNEEPKQQNFFRRFFTRKKGN